MATWYINQAGSGAGDGTAYADAASIATHNAGISGITAGDTVYVCGTITTVVTLQDYGTDSDRITYRGDYPGDAGIIDVTSGTLGINTNYRNGHTFQNLTFSGNDNTDQAALAIRASGSWFTVKDCIFTGNARGIRVQTVDDILVENCVFTGNTDYGIQFIGVPNGTVRRCTFTGNGTAGANNTDQMHTVDTAFDGSGTHCGNITVEYCTASGQLGSGGSDFDLGRCNNGVLRYCSADGSEGNAVGIPGEVADNVTVYSCLFTNIGSNGILGYGSANITVYNNTVEAATALKCGISASGQNVVVDASNNILIGSNYSIQCAVGEFTLTEDYNCAPDTSTETLGSNSFVTDPLLDSDYHLTRFSPCIGAGVKPLSLRDYTGAYLAKNTYDIGAVWTTFHAETSEYTADELPILDENQDFDATDVEGALAEIVEERVPGGALGNVSLDHGSTLSVNTALPSNNGSIRVHSHTDVFLEFGTDNTVTANGTKSLYFPAGTEVLGLPDGMTHVAIKSATGDAGAVHITGLNTTYKHTLTTNAVLPYTAASDNVALPSGKKARLFAMTDCHLAFGDSTVEATTDDQFFEAGTEMIRIPTGATHIAAVRYTTDAGLYITGAN